MINTYAVVTGASSGIGKAIAVELANRSVNLILVALPGTGLAEVAHQVAAECCVDVKFLEIDLTQERAAKEVYKCCKQMNIRIATLVNNAGLGTHGSFEMTSPSDLETMLKLNNQAVVMLTYYFLPELKSNRQSNILNVGSLASFMNIPGKAIYSASKNFIYSFSLSLRMELRPYRINVSCLCPGGTITSKRVMSNFNKVKYAGKILMQEPEQVAVEAIAKLFRGKKIIIPGWHNKLFYRLRILLPEPMVDFVLMRLFFKKEDKEGLKFRTTAVALRAIAF